MKQTVNFSRFCDGFSNRRENFSYEGLRALFDYLEDLEEGMDKEGEFDPIAICCEFTEYEDIKAFQSDYGEECRTLEDIEEKTQVIKVNDDKFIIQQF